LKRLSFAILLSILLIMFFFPLHVLAHKVNIYAYTGDGMVHSESYFADGSRCRNCIVEVFDKITGKRLNEGKTDENGRFSFKAPLADSLKLVLKAGAGHQAVYYLSLGGKETPIKPKEDKASSAVNPPTISREQCLSPSEVEAVVNKAVEAKIQPLMNRLETIQENTDKAGLREIIGGIGYILGIMGIIMYLKSRKKP